MEKLEKVSYKSLSLYEWIIIFCLCGGLVIFYDGFVKLKSGRKLCMSDEDRWIERILNVFI